MAFADDIVLYNNAYNLYFYMMYAGVPKNVKARNSSTAQFYCYSISTDKYVINGDLDAWTFSYGGSGSKAVYRQYEFNAHCQDKNGAALSGVSTVGEYIGVGGGGQAFSVSSGESGDVATQTVDHSYFNQVNGSAEQLIAPLKVTYSKPGYRTLVKHIQ